MGREIKFKPATFYLGIADHLARVVEGQEQPEEGGSRRTSDERPEPERETSGERRGRERAEMADSLGKGESRVGSVGPSPRGVALGEEVRAAQLAEGAAVAQSQSLSQSGASRPMSDVDNKLRALPEAQKRKQKEDLPAPPS